MLMFTLSKSFIRSYYSTCSTFLDLVDDPSPTDPNAQRLRIRTGTRRERPLSDSKAGAAARDPPGGGQLYPLRDIEALYRSSEIKFWPPDQDRGRPDPVLDELNLVLNPPSHQGNVSGTWDDRSLVYATGGGSDDLRALVFISFDAAIHLRGVKRARGGAARHEAPADTPPEPKGKERAASPWALDSPPAVAAEGTWAVTKPAMYRMIRCGLDFAEARTSFP